jgi:3-deoxy-D-manno-octulosonic-acid transferase
VIYIYKILLHLITPFLSFSLPEFQDKNGFWVHASSVGEINASIPFVFKLKEIFPEIPILISVCTKTGYKRAKEVFKNKGIVIRFPFDHPKRIVKIFEAFEPLALFLVETELWPNLIINAKNRRIPLFLINARLSLKSWTRYRIAIKIFSPLVKSFRFILAQTKEDGERFIELGAPPEIVKITGSLKYDILKRASKNMSRSELGYSPKDIIVVFGSVRSKEEDTILDVISTIKETYKGVKFILAPRHLIRVHFLKEKMKRKKLPFVLRSEGITPGDNVFLIDTMGELSSFYQIADIAFVGGTLTPYGGHSLIEPAYAKLPVIFGPYVFHTKNAAYGLIKFGGGVIVRNKKELLKSILHLIKNKEERIRMGERALKFVESQRGATERTINSIVEILKDMV